MENDDTVVNLITILLFVFTDVVERCIIGPNVYRTFMEPGVAERYEDQRPDVAIDY